MTDEKVFEPDCALCEDEALKDDPMAFVKRRFIVCPECGNKRCPKASWHLNSCTNSNEPGQIGSFYGPQEFWPNQIKENGPPFGLGIKGGGVTMEDTPPGDKVIDVVHNGVTIGKTYDCQEPGCCRPFDEEDGHITNE